VAVKCSSPAKLNTKQKGPVGSHRVEVVTRMTRVSRSHLVPILTLGSSQRVHVVVTRPARKRKALSLSHHASKTSRIVRIK